MKRLASLLVSVAVAAVVVSASAADTVGPTLQLTESSAFEFATGTTLYYAPTGSNTGSFSVTAGATAASGVSKVDFPNVFGAGSTTVNSAPFTNAYSWTASDSDSGAKTVTVYDGDSDSDTIDFTVTPDTTGPTGQSVALSGGPNFGTLSVPLSPTRGSDAGAGLDPDPFSGTFERASATLTGTSCGTFSATYSPVTLSSGADTTVVSGNCYRYRYRSRDLVGNLSATPSAPSADAKVSSQAPTVTDTAPTETSGAGDQYWDALTDTLYFRPAASGSFTLNATATGFFNIAKVDFPDVSTIVGWSGSTGGSDSSSPFSSPTSYSWKSGAADPGAQKVTATDANSLTGFDTIAIKGDPTPPAGQAVTLTGGPWFTSSVPLTFVAGSDQGAGVDPSRAVVERASATVSNGICGTFGTFAPVTLSSNADATVASGNCYRYQYKATDNVGNTTAASAPSTDAKVDKTPPTTPALLFSGFTNTASAGNVVYYRPAGNGSFTVAAATADPESGIASYSFPTVAGFSAVGTGPRRTYTFTSVPPVPSGPMAVTSTNTAGLNSGGASFSLVPDGGSPTLTVRCDRAACKSSPYAKTVMVTFSSADAGGSGVSTIRWTTDGAEPKATHGFEYVRGIPLQGLTHLRVRAFDKAGNASPLISLTVNSLANRLFVATPPAVVVKAKAQVVEARIGATRRSLVTARMSGGGLKKALNWHFVLARGTSVVKLHLPKTIKRGTTYRLVWTISADSRRVQKTTRVTLRR